MPVVITADDLRAVLGVSDSLYDDEYLEQIVLSSEGVIVPMLRALEDGEAWSDHEPVKSATLALAVEIFQSRIAPGGQIEGVDFTTVSPYRLGRSLFNRVSGLLGSFIDVESMVG